MYIMKEVAFHANDIRGLYPKEIDENIAREVGFAFSHYMEAKKIFVARDCRLSSKSLSDSLIKGVIESGCDVIDLGLMDTTGLYFATGKYSSPGIMITASHNPPEYNGMICVKPGALPIGGQELKGLKDYIHAPKSNKPGKVYNKDITKEYEKHVISQIKTKNLRPLHIVIDAGNGMAGKYAEDIFSNLPCKFIPLFFKQDGRFPNHLPDTAISSNLNKLMEKVKKENASFGVAYDGDADRASFVDERGEIVPASCVASIFSENILKKIKGPIVHTALSSQIVSETITKNGGTPLAEKIGHTFMKSRMRKEEAVFGAEESGHYYFKSNYYADSGLISSLLMYEILSEEKKPLSVIASKFKKYYKPEGIEIRTSDRKELAEKIKKWCESRGENTKEEFDGITYKYKDGWINVRASNTEPVVRINLESYDYSKGKNMELQLITFIKSLRLKP